MRHDEAFERLIEILDPAREHAEGDDAAVLAHAARCSTCAARIATLTRLDRSLLGAARDHYPLEDPPATLAQRVLAIPSTRRRAPQRRLRPIGAVAIPALVALAIAVTLPLWASTRGRDPVPARTMALHAHNGSLTGSVALGPLTGSTRSVRLMAEGLATGKTSNYSIWLTGPDGSILIRSFSANPGGGCDIHAEAPDGHWNAIAITMNDRPPVTSTILASAKI